MLTHEEYTTLSEMLQFTAYDGLSPVDARQGDNMYNIRMPSGSHERHTVLGGPPATWSLSGQQTSYGCRLASSDIDSL